MNSSDEIRVTRVPLPPLAALEQEWRDLEGRCDHSFFMSWHWIGSWLEHLPEDVPRWLLRAEVGGRIVGLGVVCANTIRRHGVFPSRGLYLHCTGRSDLDELTVEYNGFLAEDGLERQVTQRYIEFLRDGQNCDELDLNGWHRLDLLGSVQAEPGLSARIVRRPCCYVDLDGLRRSGPPYLERLTKKTRYHVRRSIREYGKLGELKFDVATNGDEAQNFLAELKRLHQRSWQAKGQPGSFANHFFDKFHQNLVKQLFPANVIQLARLRVGERALGYLYNFVYRGRIYHYQAGIDYDIDVRLNPGLVCQVYAIEFGRESGHKVYEFMAGELKYKSDLATDSTEMLWLVLQQPRLKFRIEEWLRSFKARLLRGPIDPGGR